MNEILIERDGNFKAEGIVLERAQEQEMTKQKWDTGNSGDDIYDTEKEQRP